MTTSVPSVVAWLSSTLAVIDPMTALLVLLATAATDAMYVQFTSAVAARRRVQAASWSSGWYLVSSFAVISYTSHAVYVLFAAAGSWIGAYVSMTVLHRATRRREETLLDAGPSLGPLPKTIAVPISLPSDQQGGPGR